MRITFCLSTPWIFAGMVAPSRDKLPLHVLKRFQHYCKLYKHFIRPLLPRAKVYHHSPVSSRGGVESSPWFAVEYSSPKRDSGWAIVCRIGLSDSDTYLFKPRGLDASRRYEVGLGEEVEARIGGHALIQRGVEVRLEEIGASQLLTFKSSRMGEE